MKATKEHKQQQEKSNSVIQKKEGNSFIKPKGDANSFSPPKTSGRSNKSLPAKLQTNMENSLGQDFSSVGIHTNSQKAVQMKARAFTQSEQIHFAPGEFNPSSTAGQNLIGHEFTHIAQQRAGVVKPTKALKKGVMINDDRSLESEADNFGRKAARGEAVSKYRSASLGMRSSVRTAQAKSNVVQMVATSGGDWDTDQYDLVTPAKSSGLRGVKIKLKFDPQKANAELIGLTQTIRFRKSGSPYYMKNKTREDHSIDSKEAITTNSATKETDEGTHIDRFSDKNTPIYGSKNLTKGQTLEDTPMNNNTSGKAFNLGVNATYRLGYRYKSGKAWKSQEAMLYDFPKIHTASKNSSQIFETTALALKGADAGTYYGSVKWGWQTDAKGKFSKIPLQVVSQGVPSSTFMKAAEKWNNGQSSTGANTTDLPIKDVKFISNIAGVNIGPGPVYTYLPYGTRVVIISGFPSMVDSFIRVIDGPNHGFEGTVTNTDLSDERN